MARATRRPKAATHTAARVDIIAKNGENLPAHEVLAEDIAKISAAAQSLTASRLRDDALIMLISHSSGVSQRNVKAVLDGLKGLSARYLK